MIRGLILAAAVAVALISGSSAGGATTGDVILDGKPFVCGNYSQPLDIDLLRVILGPGVKSADAVQLKRRDCTGHIDRIEVRTQYRDAVKVGSAAHDLTVGSALIECVGRSGKVHQDAIQVTGGFRVTLSNVVTRCVSSNHSSFFVNAGKNSAQQPTDVVCVSCDLAGGGTTVHIANAVRSGVRESIIYKGQFGLRYSLEDVFTNNVVDTEWSWAELGY